MTHSTNGKHKPAHLSPRHPDQKENEVTAAEAAAMVSVARQTALKRHERHPDRFPGRLLPHVPGVSGSGRGIWVFPVSAVREWQEEKRALRERRRKIAKLRAQGFRVNGYR